MTSETQAGKLGVAQPGASPPERTELRTAASSTRAAPAVVPRRHAQRAASVSRHTRSGSRGPQATDEVMRHRLGFVSANIHASLDGARVVNYAQWQKVQDFQAMLGDPVAGEHMAAARAMASAQPHLYTVCLGPPRVASPRWGVSCWRARPGERLWAGPGPVVRTAPERAFRSVRVPQ